MFFTTQQFDQLQRNGQPGLQGKDHMPVSKLALPGTGCVWLLSELRDLGGKRRAYGLVDFGVGQPRIGMVSLDRLAKTVDPLGCNRVLPDRTFLPRHRLSIFAYAAKLAGGFTEDEALLAEAVAYCDAYEQQRAIRDEPYSGITSLPTAHQVCSLSTLTST